jgi:hypothetical protein
MGLPRSYSAHELTQLLPVDLPVREIHLEGIPQLDDLEICKPCLLEQNIDLRDQIQRKTWCIGPYAGDYYNLALCLLQSRLQHIYHGQLNARVDLNLMPESTLTYARVDLNPMQESTLTLCQSRP